MHVEEGLVWAPVLEEPLLVLRNAQEPNMRVEDLLLLECCLPLNLARKDGDIHPGVVSRVTVCGEVPRVKHHRLSDYYGHV